MLSSGHLVVWSFGEERMLTAGTRLGPYEVTAQIGEGGMGQVYRATDTKQLPVSGRPHVSQRTNPLSGKSG